MDKKAEMLSHGPKSLHPQNTHSPNQQQSSTVNSTNNNISVSNNNRKSSETVTSSPEEQGEEQPQKAQPETTDDGQETKIKAAHDLAAFLDEETHDPPSNRPLVTEPQPSLAAAEACSVIANVDNKCNEEKVTPDKKPEAEQEVAKSEDDSSLAVKKVRLL